MENQLQLLEIDSLNVEILRLFEREIFLCDEGSPVRTENTVQTPKSEENVTLINIGLA